VVGRVGFTSADKLLLTPEIQIVVIWLQASTAFVPTQTPIFLLNSGLSRLGLSYNVLLKIHIQPETSRYLGQNTICSSVLYLKIHLSLKFRLMNRT
jgi:hypothetical protein